ncbi:hypothetical protein TWF718_001091 [Orbilia javanica]|uniref:F-box domain-containing protein n=1 Tax=Orbilia javanica TaxID=47235 RepID=A0AAN8NH19_9PEZI
MVETINSLPNDIKLLILTYLPSFDSLLSLLLSSRAFLRVYNVYKSTITQAICPNEIEPFKLEAFIIARNVERFAWQKIKKAEVSGLIQTYILGLKEPDVEEDGHPLHPDLEPSIDWAKVVENHKAVRVVAALFIKNEMARIQEFMSGQELEGKPNKGAVPTKMATDAERERIIRAIYRFWMLAMMCQRRTDGVWYAIPQMLVFENWPFWDLMAVKAISDFWFDVLLPYAVHFRDLEWTAIEYSTFFAGPPVCRPQTTRPSLVGLLETQVSLIIWKEFPAHMSQWVNNRSDPGSMEEHLKYVYECKRRAPFQNPH